MLFDRMPDKGTTPQEWEVIGCVVMPLFVVLGIAGLVYSFVSADAVTARTYRYVSAGMFAVAVLVWIFTRIRGRF